VRRVFEPPTAALAAKVASDAALESVAAAYAGMEAAKTAEELLEPDLAFHRRIAEATNNDLLAYIGNMLSLALRESIKLSSRLPNTHALSLPRHKAILTALLNRDPLAAHQATLVQLKETREDLDTILESGLDPADDSRLAGAPAARRRDDPPKPGPAARPDARPPTRSRAARPAAPAAARSPRARAPRAG
jgi:DNA-binding GntR family transcriptional regulator